MTDEKGSCKVAILLDEVTDEQVEDLTEKIADLLVAERHAATDDENLRSLITVEPYEWPDTEEELVAEITPHSSLIIIPNPEPKPSAGYKFAEDDLNIGETDIGNSLFGV